jgi:hypothetical protein
MLCECEQERNRFELLHASFSTRRIGRQPVVAGKQAPDVVVYFHHGSENTPIIASAEEKARHMLASVGISIAWRSGTPANAGSAEVIEAVLVEKTVEDFRPGALAFATLGPRSGTRIEIFYDRVRAHGPVPAVPSILAHVLAHEITHVLEGLDRHSESGVMKAHWSREDLLKMSRELPFAGEDVRLIHDWSARHNQTLQAAAR